MGVELEECNALLTPTTRPKKEREREREREQRKQKGGGEEWRMKNRAQLKLATEEGKGNRLAGITGILVTQGVWMGKKMVPNQNRSGFSEKRRRELP